MNTKRSKKYKKLIPCHFWPLIWPLWPLQSFLVFFGLLGDPLCLISHLSSFLVDHSTLGLFRWKYSKTAIVKRFHCFLSLGAPLVISLKWVNLTSVSYRTVSYKNRLSVAANGAKSFMNSSLWFSYNLCVFTRYFLDFFCKILKV